MRAGDVTELGMPTDKVGTNMLPSGKPLKLKTSTGYKNLAEKMAKKG